MQQRLMNLDLIHVAAANENCGRVVLAMPNGPPDTAAIETALVLGRAFEASLETLVVDCPEADALQAHSFAREVSHAGRIGALSISQSPLSEKAWIQVIEKAVRGRLAPYRVEHVLRQVRVPIHEAIQTACHHQGPWNMVVLGASGGHLSSDRLEQLFGSTQGATGLVVVVSETVQSQGDVVVVIDDVERLSQITRAAQRIAAVLAHGQDRGGTVRFLLASPTQAHAEELEGLVRLALPPATAWGGVEFAIEADRAGFGTHAEIAEALRRLNGAFVIARHGSAILPRAGEQDSLSAVLRAPLLLVR